MVDLGAVVPTMLGGSISGNATKTISPFTANNDRVIVAVAHTSDTNVRNLGIAIKANAKYYPIVSNSGVTITCSSSGVVTITNGTSQTIQYAIF